MVVDNNLWIRQNSGDTVKNPQDVILPLTYQRIPGVGQAIRSDVDCLATHIGNDVLDTLDALAALVVHSDDVLFGGLGTAHWGRRIGFRPIDTRMFSTSIIHATGSFVKRGFMPPPYTNLSTASSTCSTVMFRTQGCWCSSAGA